MLDLPPSNATDPHTKRGQPAKSLLLHHHRRHRRRQPRKYTLSCMLQTLHHVHPLLHAADPMPSPQCSFFSPIRNDLRMPCHVSLLCLSVLRTALTVARTHSQEKPAPYISPHGQARSLPNQVPVALSSYPLAACEPYLISCCMHDAPIGRCMHDHA